MCGQAWLSTTQTCVWLPWGEPLSGRPQHFQSPKSRPLYWHCWLCWISKRSIRFLQLVYCLRRTPEKSVSLSLHPRYLMLYTNEFLPNTWLVRSVLQRAHLKLSEKKIVYYKVFECIIAVFTSWVLDTGGSIPSLGVDTLIPWKRKSLGNATKNDLSAET